MTVIFYIAAAVAVIATLLVVTRTNLVHALLYLVVSLFAVAVIFFALGAPFVAALEVIVYAGAIMMLFIFAVMLLNVRADEGVRVPRRAWLWPAVLVAILLAEVVYGVRLGNPALSGQQVGPAAVSQSLFGPYVLGVELASMLLLAALVGARHVASQPETPPGPEPGQTLRDADRGWEPADGAPLAVEKGDVDLSDRGSGGEEPEGDREPAAAPAGAAAPAPPSETGGSADEVGEAV